MNIYKRCIIILLSSLLFLLCACAKDTDVSNSDGSSASQSQSAAQSSNALENEESSNASGEQEDVKNLYTKAVWLSQYDMNPLYTENGRQRSEASFKPLLEQVLDNLVSDGYNTVIVQVRPFADSFYPSEYYPISSYVSGAYGAEDIYDPFEIIVKSAREHGLSVHAWLNPMRGMKVEEIESVPDQYPIKQWYSDSTKLGDYLVAVNGRYYLNPAHEEVRELIAAGASEVCHKYDIDGVHIDDYFYPTTDTSFDSVSYAAYKQNGGAMTLADFRYDNINQMVRSIYQAVKETDESMLFGVSPTGNLNTTYTTLYTDVYTWCSEEGYIDYICPQIYFGLEHQTFDFKKVYNTWKSIIKNDEIALFVGMTLGKAQSGVDNYAGSGKYEWQNNKDIIKRCLEYLDTQDKCSGVVFFCYQYMYDPLTGQSVDTTKTERNNMKEALAALGDDDEKLT